MLNHRGREQREKMHSTSQVFVLSSIFLFVVYLNFCHSGKQPEQALQPRIWPNISDNSSFLQFPGLTGYGGLDFNVYQAFWKGVNASRLLPNLIAQHGNFTLIQVALMGAVGAMAAGAASILAEAYLYRLHLQEEAEIEFLQHHLHGPPHSISYEVPAHPSVHIAAYPPPPPPHSYASPKTYAVSSTSKLYDLLSNSNYGSPVPFPSRSLLPGTPETYKIPAPRPPHPPRSDIV